MPYLYEKYAVFNEIPVYKTSSGRKIVNKILLGTWLGVTGEDGDFYEIDTAGPDGWVKKKDVTDKKHFKAFYIDDGQGDVALVEVGDLRIIIDGGPGDGLLNYLSKWQYEYLIDRDEKVHIDYVFVSHFDADHYFGLTKLIEDKRFTFGTIFHNGIARFSSKKGLRQPNYNKDLGETIEYNNEYYLKTYFDDIDSVNNLLNQGGLQKGFKRFLNAVVKAKIEDRLSSFNMLDNDSSFVINKLINGLNFSIEVLGPIKTNILGEKYFKWFKDSSHTRNGHSLVLKLTYENASLLFGGDLNSHSERHLMDHYNSENPFRVDVAKSCHHGSSDFLVDFLKLIRPFATVISSGDNENYAHPRADTIGCAGKYSRGVRPKVYSTELARSVNSSGKILYGMINLRSDGKRIYMSQMKERRSGADVWDSYKIK